MTRRLIIGIVCMTAAAACGTSQQKQVQDAAKQVQEGATAVQKAAEQNGQNAQQMAQGMQQMAQGFQQMAQGSGKVVDYEQLKALVPDLSGWTRSELKGEQLSMPVQYSHATARYQKDDSHLELELTDTALSQILLAPMTMFLGSGYSERSDDGFKRAAKVGGQPGMEEWNVKSKHAEVTAVVGGRYIVVAKGDDVDSIDPVKKLAESVDFAKLAALK